MVRPGRSVGTRGLSTFPSGQTNVLVLESKRKFSGKKPSVTPQRANRCRTLPIRLNRSSEHRDTALVQCQNVFAARVAGIYHYLFWSFAQALFDLLHRRDKVLVIWNCLTSLDTNHNAGSGIGRHLYVVTPCARCAGVFHNPSFWIRDARAGLLFCSYGCTPVAWRALCFGTR